MCLPGSKLTSYLRAKPRVLPMAFEALQNLTFPPCPPPSHLFYSFYPSTPGCLPRFKHPGALPQVICTCCARGDSLIYNHHAGMDQSEWRLAGGLELNPRSPLLCEEFTFSLLLPGEVAIPYSADIFQYFNNLFDLTNLPGWMSASPLLYFLLF